jgi:death on curing protein
VRYLTLDEVLEIHHRMLGKYGGSPGMHNLGALESALAQPQMSFGGEDLYPSVAEKAAALGFSLIKNHPFIDGNKRTGHAAMEVFLVLNGYEIVATVDEQQEIILHVAGGTLGRDDFTSWLTLHLRQK